MHYRFCITGSTSAISRYFVRRIKASLPEANVLLVGRSKSRYSVDNVDFAHLDFLNDNNKNLLDNYSFDHLVHFASSTPSNTDPGDFNAFLQANVAGPVEFARLACTRNLKSIFYLSSTAVYDRTRGETLSELSPKTTKDYYGLSKLMFEKCVWDLTQDHKIPSLGLRIPVLLTDGVSNNFLAQWKSKLENNDQIVAANINAPFNAICPDWAIFETFENFLVTPKKLAEVTNIHAKKPCTLSDVLRAINAAKVDVVEASRPAQTIVSVSGHELPKFDAFTETVRFLLNKHS